MALNAGAGNTALGYVSLDSRVRRSLGIEDVLRGRHSGLICPASPPRHDRGRSTPSGLVATGTRTSTARAQPTRRRRSTASPDSRPCTAAVMVRRASLDRMLGVMVRRQLVDSDARCSASWSVTMPGGPRSSRPRGVNLSTRRHREPVEDLRRDRDALERRSAPGSVEPGSVETQFGPLRPRPSVRSASDQTSRSTAMRWRTISRRTPFAVRRPARHSRPAVAAAAKPAGKPRERLDQLVPCSRDRPPRRPGSGRASAPPRRAGRPSAPRSRPAGRDRSGRPRSSGCPGSTGSSRRPRRRATSRTIRSAGCRPATPPRAGRRASPSRCGPGRPGSRARAGCPGSARRSGRCW